MNENHINPVVAVRPAADAAELLAAANAEHEAGLRAERASLEHYRKAGEALIRAKAAVGHGKWLTLLKERSTIANQRASEYMRLAAGWHKLPPGGNFGLKEALRIIAGEPPAEDDETLEELGKRIREAYALARITALETLQEGHAIGLILAEMFAQDESATRALLVELGISEEEAESLRNTAVRRGESWEPTLRDADEYGERLVDACLARAGLPLDGDDEDSEVAPAGTGPN
jgi:hypothetical protein